MQLPQLSRLPDMLTDTDYINDIADDDKTLKIYDKNWETIEL